jgi:Response regulators consisting of a CheY-like receiver domain and a winged-helix DNA-binding domain
MKKILFVEDDEQYRNSLAQVLRKEGYSVDASDNPLQAIELFALNVYDLVISDLMMSTLDGIKFLQHIMRNNPNIRTMILTAEPSMETELEALNIQIDKYLVKETRIEVLLKHIEVLLQNHSISSSQKNQELYSPFEELRLSITGRTVTKNGQEMPLTPKEFSILKLLLMNRGDAVSRETLLEEVWDSKHELIDMRVIDVHIKEIRKKLAIQSITAVRGFGYKWDE